MMNLTPDKIDEVGIHYTSAAKVDNTNGYLFWGIVLLSLFMPYSAKLGSEPQEYITVLFLALTLIYFALSQISRFYLIPKAERMRRKQLLSNALGTHLSHEQTALYYNNSIAPSLKRLGANIMENAFFSSELAGAMLISKRWLVGIYTLAWFIAFSLRHNNLELLAWITQLVFSGEIIAGWLTMECLRIRHEKTFDDLHLHFLHDIGDHTSRGIATILDAFASYESAKSSAGILLSSDTFKKLNPQLSRRWDKIRTDLKMEFSNER